MSVAGRARGLGQAQLGQAHLGSARASGHILSRRGLEFGYAPGDPCASRDLCGAASWELPCCGAEDNGIVNDGLARQGRLSGGDNQ